MPPLHTTPIFQDERPPLISHGVPETLASGAERRTYEPGSFPSSEAYAARVLALPAYTDPVRDVLDSFVAAFAKVAERADDLHRYAAERAAASPVRAG